jgi:hypothetical protein
MADFFPYIYPFQFDMMLHKKHNFNYLNSETIMYNTFCGIKKFWIILNIVVDS